MIAKLKTMLAAAVVVGVAIGSYFLGQRSGDSVEEGSATPMSLEEVVKAESDFQSNQRDLTNRLAEVQNRIKTVKQSLEFEEGEYEIESVEIKQRLSELNAERLTLKASPVESGVPVPLDSPDGQVINQARSQSGISLKVLENYEQDTGVSPQEIEDLMHRTE